MVLIPSWKYFRFSIRSTVIAVFLISTLMTAAVAIGLQYYFSKKLTIESALLEYQHTATSSRDYLADVDDKALEILNLLAKFPKLIEHETVPDDSRHLFAEVLQRNPIFSDITVGFSQGGTYQLINLNANKAIVQQLKIDPDDYWLVITTKKEGNNTYQLFNYFDDEFNLRHSRKMQTRYDVKTRPWFVNAKENLINKTEPYLFQHIQLPGQTYSTQIKSDKNVLAVGVTLTSLSDF